MQLPVFRSEQAEIHSNLISISSSIFGPSKIGKGTILDPWVTIGYPTRPKVKEIMSRKKHKTSLEIYYDEVSFGTKLGNYNHIRSFTIIYENTTLADNVETGTNVVIRENCSIGAGSIIGSGTILDGDVKIGKNARIQSLNFIPPKIHIGDNVFLAPGVRFANDTYPVSNRLIGSKVKDNVIIGMSAIIIPGITIGRRSVIAAGALVTKDVPDDAVMLGTPAVQVMTRDEYNQKQDNYEKDL
ncbi:MAG: acyltransferase [Candidatus Kariarchaeaceae archaeon]|jgi:acetyltransferase-like isoleucine patch superfamily enzyme